MSVSVKNLLFKKRQDTCLSSNTVLKFSRYFILISFAVLMFFKGWKKVLTHIDCLRGSVNFRSIPAAECSCLFCLIGVNLLLNYFEMSVSVLFLLTTSTAQKWSFLLRISSVNAPRSAGNCTFDHICWRNL